MVAQCPGGAHGESVPGFNRNVQITTASIAALLNNIPTKWAVPIAGFLGAINYDLQNFCDQDLPAMPTITAQDLIDVSLVGSPLDAIAAQNKFFDLIHIYAWYQFCRCVAPAVTPNPPAPPAAPSTSLPAPAPPTSGTGCLTANLTHLHAAGAATAQATVNVIQGATTITLDGTYTASVGGAGAFSIGWQFNGPSGFPFNTDLRQFTGTNGTFHISIPIIAGAFSFTYSINGNGTNTVDITSGTYTYAGDCIPNGSAGPTIAQLDPQVLAMLSSILEYVTLIQRQQVPFAYIRSTVHGGLSGNGTLSVQGLIGCIVELTTLPANVGLESGDPAVVFDAGWINWGHADGFKSRELIRCSPQTSFPPIAGQYTRIGYSLAPGVTASITELRREF